MDTAALTAAVAIAAALATPELAMRSVMEFLSAGVVGVVVESFNITSSSSFFSVEA